MAAYVRNLSTWEVQAGRCGMSGTWNHIQGLPGLHETLLQKEKKETDKLTDLLFILLSHQF